MSSAQERASGYEPEAGMQAGGAHRQGTGAPQQPAGYQQPGYRADTESGGAAAVGSPLWRRPS